MNERRIKLFSEMSKDELYSWINAPIELLRKAKEEPYSFLRDSAGLPTTATNPYITEIDKIQACIGGGLINPFDPYTKTFDENWRCPFSDNFARYIHVDLAATQNAACLSMCHASSFIEIIKDKEKMFMPIIKFDCICRVLPPEKGEIDQSLFLELIEEITLRGFRIKLITYDKWSSTHWIQTLRDLGYAVDNLSIDRTAHYIEVHRESNFRVRHISTEKDYSHGHHLLKDAIYNGRLFVPFVKCDNKIDSDQFSYECKLLEIDSLTGLVSTPEKLPDDLIQTVIGCIINLFHNEKCSTFISDEQPTADVLEKLNREQQFQHDMGRNIDDFGEIYR
jgi:hypothetical protein